MSLVQSIEDFNKSPSFKIKGDQVEVTDVDCLRETCIDILIENAIFNQSDETKDKAIKIIWELSKQLGCPSASIHDLYMARAKNEYKDVTVPAINIRGFTYEFARTIFNTMASLNVGPVIFEIAKSEIDYTKQRPAEYTACVLAAAIKEGYKGPVFIQGDHFQLKVSNYKKDKQKEIESAKALIKEGIEGGFYNIDIDSSTLVDLSRPTVKEQQRDNYEVCAELTAYIRSIEPKGVTVSVGGEIGEVGEKNSTVEEFEAFIEGYKETLKKFDPKAKGISKISIQTGTSHGGVPLADGTVAKVSIDFDCLQTIGDAARRAGVGGTVQHGASTLPNEAFNMFPKKQTMEVHLATGFQNLLLDSKHFPKALKDKIYTWLKENCASENKEGQTEAQFFYKTRKKGFGPVKREIWDLPQKTKEALMSELQETLTNMFTLLGIKNTRYLVERY